MQNFDIVTLVAIALAVFVILRLRAVLGQRTGHQEPPETFEVRREAARRSREAESANVVKLPTRASDADGDGELKSRAFSEIDAMAKSGTELNKGLRQIVERDPSFMPKEFKTGADSAYEMIVNAFADGDRKILRNLLSKDVYEGFKSVLDEREARAETIKSSFVGIDQSDIRSAEVKDQEARITVRFASQIVSATYDKEGKLIDGNENDIASVTDIWTFARDTRSRDPNWKLVATAAES